MKEHEFPEVESAYSMNRLIENPIVGVNRIPLYVANELLILWNHKLGPCNRPFHVEAFALEMNGSPVAVAISASIVKGPVAGYKRNEVVELARLASNDKWANRVILRIWREVLAPKYECWLPKAVVSYSHNALHGGHIYRTDGWQKVTDRAGSNGKGGNWSRRGKGYANETLNGYKTLWLWEYAPSKSKPEAKP